MVGDFSTAGTRRLDTTPAGMARTAALEALERHGSDLSAEALDRVDHVLQRDRNGLDAEYIRAVSNPEYVRGFGLAISRPDWRYIATDREVAAVRAAAQAEHARAMSIGTPSAGGYSIPLSLDPSIRLSSDGSLNPIRRLATVLPISTSEHQLVTSDGVSAAWYSEGSEVSGMTRRRSPARP